jgi:hypothetical protein
MTAFISTGRSSGDAFFTSVRILAMTPLARVRFLHGVGHRFPRFG